jgi:hypothetical protein
MLDRILHRLPFQLDSIANRAAVGESNSLERNFSERSYQAPPSRHSHIQPISNHATIGNSGAPLVSVVKVVVDDMRQPAAVEHEVFGERARRVRPALGKRQFALQ